VIDTHGRGALALGNDCERAVFTMTSVWRSLGRPNRTEGWVVRRRGLPLDEIARRTRCEAQRLDSETRHQHATDVDEDGNLTDRAINTGHHIAGRRMLEQIFVALDF